MARQTRNRIKQLEQQVQTLAEALAEERQRRLAAEDTNAALRNYKRVCIENEILREVVVYERRCKQAAWKEYWNRAIGGVINAIRQIFEVSQGEVKARKDFEKATAKRVRRSA